MEEDIVDFLHPIAFLFLPPGSLHPSKLSNDESLKADRCFHQVNYHHRLPPTVYSTIPSPPSVCSYSPPFLRHLPQTHARVREPTCMQTSSRVACQIIRSFFFFFLRLFKNLWKKLTDDFDYGCFE